MVIEIGPGPASGPRTSVGANWKSPLRGETTSTSIAVDDSQNPVAPGSNVLPFPAEIEPGWNTRAIAGRPRIIVIAVGRGLVSRFNDQYVSGCASRNPS